MAKKLAGDLIEKNEEYTKLRGRKEKHQPVRETPDHQWAGYHGLDLPEFGNWTVEELRELAGQLGLGGSGDMGRDELIAALEAERSRRKT